MTQEYEDLIGRFYGSKASLFQLHYLCRQVCELSGDFVECGIAMGSGIACMRRACKGKRVWGYDSFEGIHLAGPNDTEQPGLGEIVHQEKNNYLQSSGVTVHPMEQVSEILYDILRFRHDDFILVKGWVQNTLPVVQPQRISLLRLDMDLYAPTLFALEQLYPKLVSGGILLIDDGNLAGVMRACEAYLGEVKWIHNGEENPVYLIK
jgi:hypothetical protein